VGEGDDAGGDEDGGVPGLDVQPDAGDVEEGGAGEVGAGVDGLDDDEEGFEEVGEGVLGEAEAAAGEELGLELVHELVVVVGGEGGGGGGGGGGGRGGAGGGGGWGGGGGEGGTVVKGVWVDKVKWWVRFAPASGNVALCCAVLRRVARRGGSHVPQRHRGTEK